MPKIMHVRSTDAQGRVVVRQVTGVKAMRLAINQLMADNDEIRKRLERNEKVLEELRATVAANA